MKNVLDESEARGDNSEFAKLIDNNINQRGDEDWQDGWIGKCIEYGPLAILCFLFVLQALSK